ncbi:hypothetical protein [Micromonospora sp. NPDC049175]|uniref:hypothetical protein n=1 Tax=unclassified Micromonospora TaxID=2617518 RepID=UPI0037175DA8
MSSTDVLEMDRVLDHPAGDLEAEMRELDGALAPQEPDALWTWFSAVRICCL